MSSKSICESIARKSKDSIPGSKMLIDCHMKIDVERKKVNLRGLHSSDRLQRTRVRRTGVAKSPEGLAPVRAIFAHGSDEVSIKVSDEGGGDLENHLENLEASFSSR